MKAETGRSKRLETVVSIILLGIISIICLCIILRQSPRITQSGDVPDLLSLTPQGFTAPSITEVYNSGNLYEKINGKAPQYTESGFERLFTQRFAGDNDELIELYLYDMGNLRNAFSVYSIQKRPQTEALPNTKFGYKTSNSLYFVHGKYYIELIAYSESEKLIEAMVQIGKSLRGKLEIDQTAEIAELSLFEQENIVAGSIKLYLANTFGFEDLTETFSSRYIIDGQAVTGFLSKRTNAAEADTLAKSYSDFLIENGGSIKKAINKNIGSTVKNQSLKIFDFYDTTEIVFSTGPFVAGVHEAENQQAAEKLALLFMNKLAGMVKSK